MHLALQIYNSLKQQGHTLAVAESCTGGLIAAAITDIAGSSAVFDRGVVTYSNQAKTDLLGVPPALIQTHGAVSAEVAQAMAEGLLAQTTQVQYTLAVTGIAGPSGGSAEKPVGLVYIACAARGKPTQVERHVFTNAPRQQVRHQAAEAALGLLLAVCGGSSSTHSAI